MSTAERLALLPVEERRELISDEELAIVWNDPEFQLRPSQLKALHTQAWIAALIAGRGFGKNMTGSHWVKKKAEVPGTRIALVARTVADCRDTVVQGPSGILSVYSDHEEQPEYVPSVRRLIWPNGSIAMTFSSAEPAQLRGPSFHCILADELATWRHVPDDSGVTAWDHCRIAARLGANPQIMVTTTPKRHAVVKELFRLAEEDPERVSLHTGSTLENSTLSSEYVQVLLDLYGGTALERQEIFGELVLVVEDALWRDEDFARLVPPPRDELITVIGVDPGTTTGGDATGIVAVAATRQRDLSARLGYVLEDATDETNVGVAPERWAARVVAVAQRYAMVNGTPAPVIAESNQGGEMIRAVVKAAPGGDKVPVLLVRSISNKAARAEPVLHAYRRRRVYHAEGADLEHLEDEMTTWEPKSGWSPNSMDAAVHGLRSLLVDDTVLRTLGTVAVAEPSNLNVFQRAAWRTEQSNN